MTIVTEHRRAPIEVVVAGEPSIARDLVGIVLGATVVGERVPPPHGVGPGASSPSDPTEAPTVAVMVAVLVDPAPEHWAGIREHGHPVVLVTSSELEPDQMVDAVLNGADAILSSSVDTAVLRATVAVVAAGGTVLTPRQTRSLVDAVRRSRLGATGADVNLSTRELEILTSIVRGDSVKQTARALDIRPKTVENVQSRLFRKLNVRNRAQAVSRAYTLGLAHNGPGDHDHRRPFPDLLDDITVDDITVDHITVDHITVDHITVDGVTIDGFTITGMAVDGMAVDHITIDLRDPAGGPPVERDPLVLGHRSAG